MSACNEEPFRFNCEGLIAVSYVAPTYLVVDNSGSMSLKSDDKDPFTPLQGASNILTGCASKFVREEYLKQFMHLCVVTFNATAKVHMAMVRVADMEPEPIEPTSKQTDFRELFTFLAELVSEHAGSYRRNGDVCKRPAIFVVTDGQPYVGGCEQPESDWLPALERLRHVQMPSREGETRSPWIAPFGLGRVQERTLCLMKSPGIPAVIASSRQASGDLAAGVMTAIIDSSINSADQGPQITIPEGCREVMCPWEAR